MDYFSTDRTAFSRKARMKRKNQSEDNGLFLWTALILILAAMTAFSWMFCIYVFGHPETAFSYNLLTRMEKLDPLRDYQPQDAPRGDFHSARDLYDQYFNQPEANLAALSGLMRRHYLKNYGGVLRTNYIKGNFAVYHVRELTPDDVFPSGLAVRAQAENFPNVVIDFIMPAEEIPDRHYDLDVNRLLQVGTSNTCAAIINISRVGEDKLCFTAVPLVYGNHTTAAGTTIKLSPPELLNLYASLPVTSDEEKGSAGNTADSTPPVILLQPEQS